MNQATSPPHPPTPGLRKGLLFVISAPSGAGKTSICSRILSLRPNLRQSISYTTRAMRPGEKDGVDYHFVSTDTFARMVTEEAFVEWARVHGNDYGTSRTFLQDTCAEGVDVLLDIDFQGAEQLRRSGLKGVFIFILPPDMDTLRLRLQSRNTDDAETICRRLANASREISQAVHFDYLVVNDDLPGAVATVHAIMLAEAARTERMIETLPEQFGLKFKA